MKKLRIAQVAPIWYPVPPKKYGGIERIVSYLTEGLVKRGHEVTLFASGDSKTSAKLISSSPHYLAGKKIPWSDTFWELENLASAFKKASNFDILHCHVGLRALFFEPFVKTPTLFTFHNPLVSESEKLPPALEILKLHKNQINACFISKSAKKLCPIKIPKSWVVYNGIDLDLFKFNPQPRDYFIWVGRVEPKKGIENAIRVAEITKIRLYLAGKIDPERMEYFEKNIKPHLSEKILYIGELPQKKLAKFYQGAIACLNPIEWPEPFGLVMAESQACGTPVIAFDFGSARELVKNGKTGFVVPFLNKRGERNIEGLIGVIKNIKKIKRINCFNWVKGNFSLEKMIKNYEKIYYEILGKY